MTQLAADQSKHCHFRNLAVLQSFVEDSGLLETEIIKFEARRGEEPTVHVVNHAFIKLAPTNTTWTEEVGCGGNIHRSVKLLGVRLVSVFRRVDECTSTIFAG